LDGKGAEMKQIGWVWEKQLSLDLGGLSRTFILEEREAKGVQDNINKGCLIGKVLPVFVETDEDKIFHCVRDRLPQEEDGDLRGNILVKFIWNESWIPQHFKHFRILAGDKEDPERDAYWRRMPSVPDTKHGNDTTSPVSTDS